MARLFVCLRLAIDDLRLNFEAENVSGLAVVASQCNGFETKLIQSPVTSVLSRCGARYWR